MTLVLEDNLQTVEAHKGYFQGTKFSKKDLFKKK